MRASQGQMHVEQVHGIKSCRTDAELHFVTRVVSRAIEEHNSSVIEEYVDPNMPHMQIIQVRNEDHTLGNLLVALAQPLQEMHTDQ